MELLALFLLFGILLGTVFGFFAMGGSFLITPLLIILGFPASEAVATGLAFVFGTSIISLLKHREYGRVDYKLGIMMSLAMSAGVLLGSKVLAFFESTGNPESLIGGAYILLLGIVGFEMMRTAGEKHEKLEKIIAEHRIRPVLHVGKRDREVSLWIVLLLGFLTGSLAGLMGVGGGFLLVPVMTILIGLNAQVAVGTTVLVIMVSSGYGTFLYSGQGLVSLETVTALLFGSALGAKMGAVASHIVPEESLEKYFGVMVMLGAVAVAVEQLRVAVDLPVLRYLSIGTIVGSTAVMTMIIYFDTMKESGRLKQVKNGLKNIR